ncbi:uncharacterized protein LOC119588638 [Penaeus monodon]|uniref:uncharacterized protein LOC119588638 n=1 Tax=Penaeus monodon TaxID=6687 RepID=UPI0018A7B23C|nr:uncharacterized protein LOC119588638 [Penaeus monodon]
MGKQHLCTISTGAVPIIPTWHHRLSYIPLICPCLLSSQLFGLPSQIYKFLLHKGLSGPLGSKVFTSPQHPWPLQDTLAVLHTFHCCHNSNCLQSLCPVATLFYAIFFCIKITH